MFELCASIGYAWHSITPVRRRQRRDKHGFCWGLDALL